MSLAKRKRVAATTAQLGAAYRAFLGDADERARMAWLLPELYAPFLTRGMDGTEVLSFGEFLEANKCRVELYEPELPAFIREESVHA